MSPTLGAPGPPQIGIVLIGQKLGHYEIVEKIGEGGMGEVYRARDPRLGRDVAIKVLTGQRMDSADARARFEREARAVAALSHPNILAIHDIGEHEGTAYAVTELLAGQPLLDELKTGALPLRRADGRRSGGGAREWHRPP